MKLNQYSPIPFLGNGVKLTLLILAGLLFAAIKLNGTPIDQTLWAEDGMIFINQARELGISAIWTTYAGYFHLYPRLVAWFSSFFSISKTPFIFFSAWILAYVSLIYVVANRARLFCDNSLEIVLLTFTIIAQPHSTEVFFNLTNVQWFIGSAVAIYLLVPHKNHLHIGQKVLLSIAFLTGPIILVMMPILLIQLLIYRDWQDRKTIYTLAVISAIIQIIAIILSHRLSNTPLDKDITHWLTACFTFFTFGQTTTLIKIVSVLLWSISLYALLLNWQRNIGNKYHAVGTISLLLAIAAMLFFMAGLLACKDYPQNLTPLGAGARYFYIPYGLILFSVWLAVLKQPKVKWLIGFVWLMLCHAFFQTVNNDNLQFKAYAEFAKRKSGVLIPINPNWATNSSWYIRLLDMPESFQQPLQTISLDIADAQMKNINKAEGTFPIATLFSLDKNPQISFSIAHNCLQSTYIGLEAHIIRSEAGWIKLFWSESGHYVDSQSLRRFYITGEILAQFALPRRNIQHLQLIPLDKMGHFQIVSVTLFCL